MRNRHLIETRNLVISFDCTWFLAKNLAYAECRIMKFHYRNSSKWLSITGETRRKLKKLEDLTGKKLPAPVNLEANTSKLFSIPFISVHFSLFHNDQNLEGHVPPVPSTVPLSHFIFLDCRLEYVSPTYAIPSSKIRVKS